MIICVHSCGVCLADADSDAADTAHAFAAAILANVLCHSCCLLDLRVCFYFVSATAAVHETA